VGVWIIVCIQKPSHHFLQTLRPLCMFKIVFRDSSLYPKQSSLFCLLWLISASFTKPLVWKTWIWRQIMTPQTTHTKYKWRHTPLNAPPWKFSAYATAAWEPIYVGWRVDIVLSVVHRSTLSTLVDILSEWPALSCQSSSAPV